MWKKLLINFLIDAFIEALINGLHDLAKKSNSKIDDKMVKVLHANRDEIKVAILEKI